MICPKLIEKRKIEKLSEVPQGGSAPAGTLVEKNAGWRNKRPVLSEEKCIGCFQCYLYCPDGVIRKADKKISIDYDFCKGCGICQKICPVSAIRMEDEK